jgi:hypothetical protein
MLIQAALQDLEGFPLRGFVALRYGTAMQLGYCTPGLVLKNGGTVCGRFPEWRMRAFLSVSLN